MSQNTESEGAGESEQEYPELAIEGELPLKAVGIENLKEANPKHMPPHRYIHPWFARRPTPAARLSVLGSVMPEGTTPDEMLSLMQIGPDDMDSGIAEYVEQKKATESQRDGTLGDWYGYLRPFTQSPTQDELESLHDTLRDTWDEELPTVLDATAGGGVIPFESIRYGLPTVANELNPVASLILKVMLEYAPEVGSLEEELYYWRDEILETASENLSEYYPTKRDGRQVLASVCTYHISCDSCGGTTPLVPKWWIHKRSSSEGVAIRPEYEDGAVSYECVELTGDNKYPNFDPSDAPVSRSDVECPHCGVVTEYQDVREMLNNGDFEYYIYGVKYDDPSGGSGYRAGSDIDQQALQKAQERIESDFDLLTFLADPVEVSSRITDPSTYGMEEWRDTFNPRQLVAHYELLQAFKSHKIKIQEEYDDKTANAILSLLTIASSKVVDRNSRLASWDTSKGYPDHIFKSKNFSFCRIFSDNNPISDTMGYEDISQKVIDSYESMVDMTKGRSSAEVHNVDAAELTDYLGAEQIQAAVVDPPYYDSIMYAQLSDVFYVLQKEYLTAVHPELYDSVLTNKQDEAVADPSRFDGISGDQSKKQMAKQDYEDKMSDIFNGLYDVVEPGGVLTIMFTHKETDAWDTLSMSLIDAGFTITATHPITSEMPNRAVVRGANSADSTILLTGRKPTTESDDDGSTTLWEQVREETQREAKKAARELLDSGLSLTRTDTIIAAFGPTLQVYSDNYPVVDKRGNHVPPRDALAEARDAVVQVFADRYLETSKFDNLDNLTRWYILSWLVYGKDNFPYDEGRQLGMGVGVDIDEVKRETKIWGKRSGDIQLNGHSDRVQDIVRLDAGEDVSQRKYPVDPTKERFSHAIDIVHSAIHVYEEKGADAAWDWLTERNLKNDQRFETAVKALLEVLPANDDTSNILLDMVSGKTGDYLDIDISTLNLNVEQDEEGPQQTGINGFE
jgi:putative DNA methylase